MKTKYQKVTFNLPFGGYGTYVQKLTKVDGEWHVLGQKNFPVEERPDIWSEVPAEDVWKGNYD